MKVIQEYIRSNLRRFLNVESISSEEIIESILNDNNLNLIAVIRYIDIVINQVLYAKNDNLNALHIHIEREFSEAQKLLIAEYLLVSRFKFYQYKEQPIDQQNIQFEQLITKLKSRKKSLEMNCPEGASRKNGGNRIWRDWSQNKNDIKSILDFYLNTGFNSPLYAKSIFNTQKTICKSLNKKFELKPYAVMIGSQYPSYGLLNSTNSLNEIDTIDSHMINDLESIILFDCDRKSLMTNFSFEEIEKWNTEYETKFKNYLIVTFGRESQSINSIRNKVQIIWERFKIPSAASYIVLSSEFDFLLDTKKTSFIYIEFIGLENSDIWETFIRETRRHDIYELRSIKLMNIFSICYNDAIKNYILDDLFSDYESYELVSSNTKMAILELSEEDIEVIKQSLSNTLDLIINSEIKSRVIESLCFNTTKSVVLDDMILRNSKLLSLIKNALGISSSTTLKSWSSFKADDSNLDIILSYRDQGNFPNYLYPNLLEYRYTNQNKGNAILLSFLFRNHYEWANYNNLREYHKYLNHPIRENYFQWNELEKLIYSQKPESKLIIDWDLENEYSGSESRETYKIKLYNHRPKTYHSSDFLIFSDAANEKLRIERIKWFYENVLLVDTQYRIQKLDELLDEFNPAQKLIDTSQQEIELGIIRKQLGLGNETAGRIWKILLRKKSELLGVESTYEDLNKIFDKNKIPLVSINHFRNSWINIESDSLMPRGNKVFKFLCDYLGLNNNYRLILYRLKNASISGKIEATKKYSNLLKDLFADGCFDKNALLQTILQSRIQYYRNNHSLDELGIDSLNPLHGLITLIELILPELKLLELETIEKISNE